jgi:YesN/AraC family two-component response regulator
MDIDMPVKNGFEATLEIIDYLKTYNVKVPIVCCSAFNTLNEINRSKEVGMIDYISKPISWEDLVNVLCKIF